MKRLYIVALLAVIAAGVVRGQQGVTAPTSAGAQFEAAIKKEVVDGDLKTAIEMYRKLAQASDRGVAAKALMRMGQCYETLGDAQARKAYEQVVREFGDQAEVVAEARTKLAALARVAIEAGESTMTVRRVWTGAEVDDMGRVFPDGRFMSFTDWATGDLAIHDLATGQNRRLTDKGTWAASEEFAEFSVPSPDGRQIACNWYNSNFSYDLRIIGLDGSKPRVLRTAGDGVVDLYPMAWSPDGRHLLAVSQKADGAYDMLLVAVADGSAKLLKALGQDDRSPGGAFSPDGEYIGLAVKDGLSLFELQTGKEYPLVRDLTQPHVLGWAPDGKHLLFSSDRSGSTDMWLIAVADGKAAGEPELVKKGYGGNALGFTRAGAFYYGVVNPVRDVHVAELDAKNGRVVTPPQPVSSRWVGITRSPDWSPDGRFLAYVRNPTLNDSVVVIRSTSTGEERDLQVGKMRIGLNLRWAPDGKAIVVPGFESGKGWNLMRVDVQSGQATSVMPLPPSGNQRFDIDMSSDGRTVFYITLRHAQNTSEIQLLARDLQSGRETEVIQKAGLFRVSVSPDGQRLLIGAQEDKSLVWRIMPATGGDSRVVVRIDAEEANYRVGASWTPDGRHVVFTKGQRGRPTRNVQVWRVAAEGGEPQRLGLTVDELWWLRLHPDGRRVAIGTWKTSVEVWVMENFLPKAAAAPSAKAK
jgi:Tol biopolymer transport system component